MGKLIFLAIMGWVAYVAYKTISSSSLNKSKENKSIKDYDSVDAEFTDIDEKSS